MNRSRTTRRIRTLAVGAALALLASGLPLASADVPVTEEPVTYTQFPPVVDPGRNAPGYFQPYWYDTDGRHIQAHGGQVIESVDEQGPIYYWYGEDRSNGYYLSPGVSGYSSRDGYNWTNMGVVLRSVTDREELTNPYFDGLYDTVDASGAERTELVDDLFYNLNVDPIAPDGSQRLSAIFERPKVLYNEADDTWVMWWHADGKVEPGGSNYARSMAAVAVADSPAGPFKLVGSYRLYNRADYKDCNQWGVPGQARDMTLYKDDDGVAWIVYSSEENASLYMARLDEHYTNVEKTTTVDTEGLQYSADGRYPYIFADGTPEAPVRGEHFQIVRECGHLESPAVFSYDDRYYVVTSGTTGWAPNQNTYYSADSLTGEWIRGVVPDDPYELVPYSQVPEGGDGRISIDDHRQTTFGSQSTHVFPLDAANGKFVYMGDRWNDGAADSTYVWLPIVIGEHGRLELHNPAQEDPERWGDGWDESYWDDKGAGPRIWTVSDDRLPDSVERDDLEGVLPSHVEVTAGGQTTEVAVTWDASGAQTPGERTIRGTLAASPGYTPGRTFTRTIQVLDGTLINIAPEASVSATSRQDLARTTNDGNLKAKGWDDWTSSGYPLRSALTYTWPEERLVDALTVHTYRDGTASWPSTISVEYRTADGTWVPTGAQADVEQDASSRAPEVTIQLPEGLRTNGIRVVLETATNVWQSISEVEIFGEGTATGCGPVVAPWRAATWGNQALTTFCQTPEGGFRIGDNNGGAWTSTDALSVIGRDAAIRVGESIVTTVSSVDPGGNSDPRAGLILRNDLSAAAKGTAKGYVVLASSPRGTMMQFDSDGNGFIDTETAIVAEATWPLQLRLEYTDATTATGYWRKSETDEWQRVGSVALTGAQEVLDAGVFASGNNNRGLATVVFEGTALALAGEPEPSPSPSPSASPSPEPSATPSPSASPSSGGEPSQTPSGGPTPKPGRPLDVYTTPGFHVVNDRRWHTECEPYSQTVRCRTDIWATQVSLVDGRYVATPGWAFNNLTYLPFMTREQWAGNPLGHAGAWTAADGRRWRTECDTAQSGRNGCRSYAWVSFIGWGQRADGSWRYYPTAGWVFNNIVRFKG